MVKSNHDNNLDNITTIHFIHDHIYPKDYTFKNSSTKYTELTHIEEKEDIENKLPTTIE